MESHDVLFNRFTLTIPDDAMRDCSGQGRVDEAVKFWVTKVRWDGIDPDDIREELREYGAWDEEELEDDDENRERILWIAACNIREELDR